MDPNQNRPRGRQKNVTSGGSGAYKRGDGLGTGQVGSADHSAQRPTGNRPAGNTPAGDTQHHSGSGVRRAAIGGGGGLGLILLLAALFILPKLFGGGAGGGGSADINDLVGGMLSGGSGDIPSGFSFSNDDVNTGGSYEDTATEVDNTVVSSARAKRTKLLGNNNDKVTIMLYMCGTDLESKYGMASSDMGEIAAAKYGDNVNIIVYTGGCKAWKTQGISNKANQIYQIKDGGLRQLVADDGNKPMTSPDTLAGFIKYCNANFPANRNELILWDHGGGSVSGYGYDEKMGNGSMDLAGISKALKSGGVTFDFIGFDACLMATAENALMLDDYADYLIASEETEPGVGWYYTNWVTKLGSNTSMPTLEIGKNIVDDFVSTCAVKCKGQKTTLSVIDLAEFSSTVPSKLNTFANSVSTLITNKEYQKVSDARYSTREFAEKSKIDQVDLVDLAENMTTQEGVELSAAIKSAVKYNRTSSNISDAHGVSIYFPYKRTSYVDPACATYSQIGMGDAYSKCIRQFAKLETSGQIAAGGSSSPFASLFSTGSSGSSGTSGGAVDIGSLLSAFLGGGGRAVQIDGLDKSNIGFMDESTVSENSAADFIALNHFDVENLVWTQKGGEYKMTLPEEQWALVHSLDLNMFYDDGEGYIDLGLDNIYSFDSNGDLVADTSRNWLAIDGHTIAYYHTDTIENGDEFTITGYVPAYLNNERVN
ncbi:MAG: clostripain-related cysteine peptidase, partial [Ruminococcus sp.]|nr:clostripain-related cysteine peptidase [Ruminococcus sp.]